MNVNASTVEAVSALDILRGEYRRIQELIRDFQSVDRETKKYVARTAIEEIKLNHMLEQKVLFPAIHAEAEQASPLLAEIEESHRLAQLLIAELQVIPHGERYNAKFAQLSETVLSCLRDTQDSLFPLVEKSGMDLEVLGVELSKAKTHAMIRRSPFWQRNLRPLVGLAVAGLAAAVIYRAVKSRDR